MKQSKSYQGPLAGLNVIDFGHYYAGPLTAMLLADQGANVVHIVRPGLHRTGATTPSQASEKELPDQQYRLLNRNKKLLALDLKSRDGKEQALKLIEKADVLIENFRPGVMYKLGLDYASVKSLNSRLIYLSLPGFASTDKKRAHIQAWEGVLGAAAGVYTDTSFVRPLLNYPPVYSWVPLCSVYGGTHGAIAVMAALHAREECNAGNLIEVPLVEAGISAYGGSFLTAWVPGVATGFRSIDENGVQQSNEDWPTQAANRYSPNDDDDTQLKKLSTTMRRFTADSPFMGSFPCADGREIWLWAGPVEKLLKKMGIYNSLLEKMLGSHNPWPTQINVKTINHFLINEENRAWLTQQMKETFLTKTAFECEDLLANTACNVVVRTREEWLSVEPLLKSGLNVEMKNGKSTIVVPGRLADIQGPGGALCRHYDEPTEIKPEQLQAWLDRDVQDHPDKSSANSAIKKGDLLASLKILDMSNVVAGPTSAYTLAQYGAQVIKLDLPDMMLGPAAAPMTLEIGQGKRSILADVKSAPGQEILKRLIAWADVIVHNNLDDVAKRLGISQEQLAAMGAKTSSCQISCFGGTDRGGWELRPGFDTIPQAASGMMAQYGTLEEPHVHGRTACGDNMGGMSLAFSALLAAWQKRTQGYAGEARTSMARAINYMQLPYMIAENGRSDWGEPHGQLALGKTWYQRLYQCQDSWIYVNARDDQQQLLLETLPDVADADVEKLEAAFREQRCSHWQKALDNAGIACHPVRSVTNIVDEGVRYVSNEDANETSPEIGEIFCWKNHPCGQPIIMKAPDWVLVGEERSFKRLTPTPIFGQNSLEILEELGFDSQEISELMQLGVVHEFQPGMGRKDAYFFQPQVSFNGD